MPGDKDRLYFDPATIDNLSKQIYWDKEGKELDATTSQGQGDLTFGDVKYPGYKKILTDTGEMPDELKLQYDPEALQALEKYAFSTAPSPWADIKMGRVKRAGLKGMDEATQQAMMRAKAQGPKMSEEMKARSIMADRMGLGTQALMGSQKGQLGVNIQDRLERLSTQRNLPQMELQSQLPEQFNIRTALKEKKQEREAERETWKQRQSWEGAQEIAKAIDN